MTHLLIHLVKEINILGPVFLHNMFPLERFMGVLKNMFTSGVGQKEALPRDTEQRRSLSSVWTSFLTLTRLVFLNHGMRGDLVERVHWERKHISAKV
jgi:hypothetical protein